MSRNRIFIFVAVAIVALSILFLTPVICHTKAGGTTAGAFLLIDPGARSTAMGGAQVGITDGLDAVYWNPAALGHFQKIEVSASYLNHFEGVTLTNGSVGVPADIFGEQLRFLGSFGLRFTLLSSGDITKTDIRANRVGTFGTRDMVVSPTWGKKLMENLSVGAGLKYISQSVDDVSATGFALDAGTIYTLLEERLNLGLALQNFGTSIKDASLPSIALFGLAYKPMPELTLAGQGDIGFNSPSVGRIGVEYVMMGTFPVRLGYKIAKDNLNSVNFGLGMIFRKALLLDYAFGLSSDVSSTHRISIGYRFGAER